jgi:hypothetical protein
VGISLPAQGVAATGGSPEDTGQLEAGVPDSQDEGCQVHLGQGMHPADGGWPCPETSTCGQ